MKKLLSIAAGLLAGAALMTALPAMARNEVIVSIGGPAVVAHQAPVYGRVHPRYVVPTPVYAGPRPARVERHYRRDRHENRHEQRARNYRDHDGDGVPNRHDRRPYNPYRY
jgi:hypothetical protein